MDINLSPQHIKEITRYLEKGYTCHIHMENGAIIAFPEYNATEQGEMDQWESERALIVQNWLNYLIVPPPSNDEFLKWMRIFASEVQEQECRDNLLLVLNWKNAYHNFRKVLLDYPAIRKEWYHFRQKSIRDWACCILNNNR